MLAFLLTHSDTRDCYYFESNLSLVLPINVLLIEKACKVDLYSPKQEEILFAHEFIFVLIMYCFGRYCQKMSKVRASKKRYKGRGWSNRVKGLCSEGWFKLSAHYALCRLIGRCCPAQVSCSYTKKINMDILILAY